MLLFKRFNQFFEAAFSLTKSAIVLLWSLRGLLALFNQRFMLTNLRKFYFFIAVFPEVERRSEGNETVGVALKPLTIDR